MVTATEAGSPGAIGRYRVEARVGEGAAGVVYRARDPLLQRTVAVKVPRYRSLTSEEAQSLGQAFYREAAIAGRFQHPNVVTVYDVSRDHDMEFMVMEFVPGASARDWRRGRDAPHLTEVLAVAHGCCLALDYVHYHGIVHRDLKPANVLVNPARDVVKLTDFSIGHKIEEEAPRDQGTMAYMAPENFDNSQPISTRTDIYGLGCTIYELLTGRPPFRGTPHSIVYRIAHEEPEPIRNLRPGVPETLARIIERAMSKRADERYESALAFAADLGAVSNELGAPAAEAQASALTRSAGYLGMRQNVWFRGFAPELVNELIEIGELEPYAADKVVVREGDHSDTFFALIEGAARVAKAGNPIGVLEPGACFGETALFSQAARTASVITTEPTLVWKVSGAQLEAASDRCRVAFLQSLLATVMQRLDDRTRDVATLRGALDMAREAGGA